MDDPMPLKSSQVRVEFLDGATEPQVQLAPRGRFILGAVGLLALALLAHGWSVGGEFLLGDDVNITANPAIHHWSGLGYLWLHPHLLPQRSPFGFTSLLVDYRIAGSSAPWYRFVNLILHGLAASILWRVLHEWGLKYPWLGAALFAVHPLAVDAVAWPSQRGLLLCAIFFLLAVREWLSIRQSTLWILGWFFLAVASNPSAVMLPPVLLLLDWMRSKPVRVRPLLIVTAACVAMLPLQLIHLPRPVQSRNVLLVPYATLVSFWKSVAPVRLSFDYQLPASSAPLVGAIAALAIAAVGLLLWRRFWFGFVCVVALLFAGGVLANFSDSSAISPLSDHVAYLPLAALVGVACGALGLITRQVVGAVIGACAIVALMVLTALHTREYRSQSELWAAVLERDSKSIAAHNALGAIELSRRNLNAAMDHFKIADQLQPDDVPTLCNIGAVYDAQKLPDKSIPTYSRAKRLNATSIAARRGLAMALVAQGSLDDAMREYDEMLKLAPRDAEVYVDLGLACEVAHDDERAAESYRLAIDLDPRNVAARVNLANVLFRKAQIELAVEQLERVVELDPTNFAACMNAGAMVGSLRDFVRAEKFFRAAVAMNEGSVDAWLNLGKVCAAQRDFTGAVTCLKKASKLAPDNNEAAQLLQAALAELEKKNAPAK